MRPRSSHNYDSVHHTFYKPNPATTPVDQQPHSSFDVYANVHAADVWWQPYAEEYYTNVNDVSTGTLLDLNAPFGDQTTVNKETPFTVGSFLDHKGTGTYHVSQTDNYETVFSNPAPTTAIPNKTLPPNVPVAAGVKNGIDAYQQKWIASTVV